MNNFFKFWTFFTHLKTKKRDKRCHLRQSISISLGYTIIQLLHLCLFTCSVENNGCLNTSSCPWQLLPTVALSCYIPLRAAAPASLCCSPPLADQTCMSPGQSSPFAAWCLASHSMHLLAAHLLLASQVRHFRSHGFWTASCVVPFSKKSVPIRPFLYYICLKLSCINELISY